tara:strand:- start:1764 stop:2744 length:981 start_codon:yes stop_codon:yes gene_type:complete
MALPYRDYQTAGSNVLVENYLNHSQLQLGNVWRAVEEIHVKDNTNTWRKTKEVYVKTSGTEWKKVHEGEHFHFKHDLSSNSTGDFNLATWISNFYSGNKVKGLLTVGSSASQNVYYYRRQVNLGNFSSDSVIYLRLNLNCRISAGGGNGGNVGGNGQNGQRALYSRTPFVIDNAGSIWGGGGGGAGGNNSNYTYPVQQSFSCQKGETCQETNNVTEFVPGGGGGGGAGYPAGNGGSGGSNDYNGANGQDQAGGGGGGASQNGTSNVGGKGGNPGQNGENTPGGGTEGAAGTAIDGWSYTATGANAPPAPYGSAGNGTGDIRGPVIN